MSKTFRSNMRKDVRSLQDAHVTALGDRALKWLDLAESASDKRLLARLEAENAQLADLMLQIQALRDAFGNP